MEQKELNETISSMSSQALAAHIVAYKFLGINRNIALACMQEIANRKNQGDQFDYDDFIAQELEKLPKPQTMDHNSILSIFKTDFSKMVKK